MKQQITIVVLTLTYCFLSVSIQAQTFSEWKVIEPISSQQQNMSEKILPTPENSLEKCNMYDGSTFYLTPTPNAPNNKSIMKYDANGQLIRIGYTDAPPKGWPDLVFMLIISQEPQMTYAVDNQGFIWQRSRGYSEIAGMLEKLK